MTALKQEFNVAALKNVELNIFVLLSCFLSPISVTCLAWPGANVCGGVLRTRAHIATLYGRWLHKGRVKSKFFTVL